jgi:hypothetical protein
VPVIVLVVASAITLAALQESINAPTQAFRGCLHDAAAKATGEKISGDAIEAYLRNACTVQMSTLKSAIVAFRMKNGMGKKAAVDDADMTVDDYVATPVDNYQFLSSQNAPKPAPPPPTPASNPQPPKP